MVASRATGEKLEAWKPRIKSSEHELMLWKRRKEHKRGQVQLLKKKGTRKKYGEIVMELEDEAECCRKLDEQRKKMEKERARSNDCLLFPRKLQESLKESLQH